MHSKQHRSCPHVPFFTVNEDFNAGTTYFFRFENSQAANISIPTYRDTDALEGTESFSVNVVSQTLPSGVELDPSRASTVVNIMDFVGKQKHTEPDSPIAAHAKPYSTYV